MNSLAIGDKLQTIKEMAIGGCEDIEVSEKIFDLCDEILGLVNSASCNCQHNSNSRDNEPCCRCDSRQTNADRIRNMSDEELAEWLTNMGDFEKNEEPYKSIYNLGTEKEEEIHDSYGDLLKWLQSEAE